MAFPSEIDEWLSTEYEDVNPTNSNVIQNYTFLLNKAIDTGDFTSLNTYINDNKDVLKKVIVSASTINNIQNAIKSVEKYVITEKRNIYISEDEPSNMNIGDVWLQMGIANEVTTIAIKQEDGTFFKREIFSLTVNSKVNELSNNFNGYIKAPSTPHWIKGNIGVKFESGVKATSVDITEQVKTYFPEKLPNKYMFTTSLNEIMYGITGMVNSYIDYQFTGDDYTCTLYAFRNDESEGYCSIDWAIIYSENQN